MADDIHDIAGLIEQPTFWQQYGWSLILTISLILLASVGFICYRLRRKRTAASPPSPRQVALDELQKLMPHAWHGEDAAFADAICTILRRYIENHSTKMPTEPVISDHFRKQADRIIAQCQPVRFAGEYFAGETRESLYKRTKALLETHYADSSEPKA